ncbi:MAG TPA: YbaB/EbfC family nucleoid-associated protein [Actinomycetota bacterium]|nr:YbaB/EbfC family nucleoid-associated protein [Actinomycetota bacterium]
MDMNKMMKQVQKMQADLAKAQEDLAEQEIEGQAGNGLVKVTVTGGGEFTAIAIDPKAVDPDDSSLLEDLVLAAVRDALSRQQALAQDRLAPLTGGLGLPGL